MQCRSFNVELFDGWYKNSILQRMDKLAHSVYINWSGKEFKNGVLLPLPVGRSAKSRYPEWGERERRLKCLNQDACCLYLTFLSYLLSFPWWEIIP